MYKSKKDNQLKSARDSGTLFSRLFISCQWRRRDLENFFAHENQSLPPSLSENGDLSPVKTRVTKLDKRNKTASRKFDNDVVSANCDVIIIFPIYGQFGAIRKPDSRHIVCKTYIFINSNFLSYKK